MAAIRINDPSRLAHMVSPGEHFVQLEPTGQFDKLMRKDDLLG